MLPHLSHAAGVTGWGGGSEKGGSAVELQQRTGNGGHIPVDDGLVSSAPNDAYGALGGGETWSGVPLVQHVDDHSKACFPTL